MKYLLWLLAIILIIWFLRKFYVISHNTVVAFTGGLGSDKTLLGVKKSKSLLARNIKKVVRYNRWHKKKKPIPLLYSNIPIRINGKLWSTELKVEHLLLREKIVEKSVVFIDEVGSWASQFDFQNPNIADNFDEFVRLFRHYTKGGYMVVTDQCSENIVLQIRRRLNTVFNLMLFRKYLGFIYTVKVRNISVSEEIKTVEEKNAEGNFSTLIGLLNPFRKSYDTYCYSDRYNTVPLVKTRKYSSYKKMNLLTCPRKRVAKLVHNETADSGTSVGSELTSA
jgi:hypothetical protein